MHDINYYIDKQGEAMLSAISESKKMCSEFTSLWNMVRPDRLYLVGSGTSGNAIRAAAKFMGQMLEVETLAISPSSIPQIFGSKPLFVFVSQGGYSTNTLRAIEQLKKYPSVALTGEKICRVNEMCENHVVLNCEHEDAGPKTMGYVCTIITLYLMALEAAVQTNKITGNKFTEIIAKLKITAQAMSDNVLTVRKWYSDSEQAMLSVGSYMVVGTGTGRFIAQEAALKVQETVLRPAIGFEYEEYLHGPTSMMHAKPAGMFLMPPKTNPDYQRMDKLAAIQKEFGCFTITVESGNEAKWENNRLVLKACDEEYLTPFWQIIPSQVIAACLPEKLGLDLKSRELFMKIDAAVGIKYGGIV